MVAIAAETVAPPDESRNAAENKPVGNCEQIAAIAHKSILAPTPIWRTSAAPMLGLGVTMRRRLLFSLWQSCWR